MPGRDDFPTAAGATAELAHGKNIRGYQEGNLLNSAKPHKPNLTSKHQPILQHPSPYFFWSVKSLLDFQGQWLNPNMLLNNLLYFHISLIVF